MDAPSAATRGEKCKALPAFHYCADLQQDRSRALGWRLWSAIRNKLKHTKRNPLQSAHSDAGGTWAKTQATRVPGALSLLDGSA